MNPLSQPDSPASRYLHWWQQGETRIREDAHAPGLVAPRTVPEAEWEVRWFAGELGREFRTTRGEPVTIIDFGRWNREEGPRFINAAVAIAGAPPVRGAIELNASPLDWLKAAADAPEYESVILHLFPGEPGDPPPPPSLTRSGREVRQVALSAARFAFSGEPALCAPGSPPPLETMEEPRLLSLLESAAQYRLCRKLARLREGVERFGPHEALYQALAETLGYRSNRIPFRLLAQRFTLEELRTRPEAIEPILFAGSGFMNATELAALPGDTRSYLRELWEAWWPFRSGLEWLALPVDLWQAGGTRPVNHPQRRLAALTILVSHWPIIHSLAAACDPRTMYGFFRQLRHPYWDHHYTLTSRRSASRMALVGPSRVTDMLANVFVPHAISNRPALWESYRLLPASDANRRVQRAIRRFIGRREPATRLRMVHQQGFLQLDEDHQAQGGNDDRLADRASLWRGEFE